MNYMEHSKRIFEQLSNEKCIFIDPKEEINTKRVPIDIKKICVEFCRPTIISYQNYEADLNASSNEPPKDFSNYPEGIAVDFHLIVESTDVDYVLKELENAWCNWWHSDYENSILKDTYSEEVDLYDFPVADYMTEWLHAKQIRFMDIDNVRERINVEIQYRGLVKNTKTNEYEPLFNTYISALLCKQRAIEEAKRRNIEEVTYDIDDILVQERMVESYASEWKVFADQKEEITTLSDSSQSIKRRGR